MGRTTKTARTHGSDLLDPYTALFNARFHGAANLKGLSYQVMYMALRATELTEPDATHSTVTGEGLEDVDLSGVSAGAEYVQVKHFAGPLRWSQFVEVIAGFREVMLAASYAEFRIVTSRGYVPRVVDFLAAPSRTPSEINSLATELQMSEQELVDLLERITLTEVKDDLLVSEVKGRVAVWFAGSVAAELFLPVLLMNLTEASIRREPVGSETLAAWRSALELNIERASRNPAVRDRLVAPMTFEIGAAPGDFLEGVSARPDHIASGLDVLRPEMMGRVLAAAERSDVCALVASSGQGKSTIAMRFLRDTAPPGSVFAIRACETSDQANQIARFLLERVSLGAAVWVLVDNLNAALASWYQVGRAVAGNPIKILVTSREEDWARHSGTFYDQRIAVVRLDLTEAEALAVYERLLAAKRVHHSCKSARRAFERVCPAPLLIEFIYLVTHGQLLRERLAGQVKELRSSEPALVEALRIVSLADCLGGRVSVEGLLAQVQFQKDAPLQLLSLENEYIMRDGDEVRGLHPVRSAHLLDLLVSGPPGPPLLSAVILCASRSTLIQIAGEALGRIGPEAGILVTALAKRVATHPEDSDDAFWGAFVASEKVYFGHAESAFSLAYSDLGNIGVTLLSWNSLPVQLLQLSELSELNGPLVADVQRRSALLVGRERLTRFECLLRAELAGRALLHNRLKASVLEWGETCSCDSEYFERQMQDWNWGESILDLDIRPASRLADTLWRIRPAEYESWARSNADDLLRRIRSSDSVVSCELREKEFAMTVLVDGGLSAAELNEATVAALRIAKSFFPWLDQFVSKGYFVFGDQDLWAYDPAKKALSGETLYRALDTERNAAWIRVCQEAFAADSVDEFALEIRSIGNVIESIMPLLEELAVAVVTSSTVSQGALDRFFHLDQQLRWKSGRVKAPPFTLPEEARTALNRAVTDFTSHLENSIRFFAQFVGDRGDEQATRLMLGNFRSWVATPMRLASVFAGLYSTRVVSSTLAPEKTRSAMNALELAAAGVHLSRDEAEKRIEEMARLFDEGRLDSARQSLSGLPFAQRIKLAQFFGADLDPLSGGFPLPFFVVLLEIESFFLIDLEIQELCAAFGQRSDHGVGFLFVVPTLDGRTYGDRAWRTAFDTCATLAEGSPVEGPLGFWTEYPPGITEMVGDVVGPPLPELALAGDVAARLVDVARLLKRRNVYLDQNETSLPTDLQLLRAQRDLTAALEDLRTFSPATTAAQEWETVVRFFESNAGSERLGGVRMAEYLAATGDLGSRLASYLEAAYRQQGPV